MSSSQYSDPQSFLNSDYTFAVVGASNDRAYFGFYVYAALKKAGFSVSPVNSEETNIQGDPCFPNLTQLRPFADVVVYTIPAESDENMGIIILSEMKNLGFYRFWIEPQCETPEMLEFAQDNNIEVIRNFALRTELTKRK